MWTHRKQALGDLGDDAADEEGHEQRQEQRRAADVPYTLVRSPGLSAVSHDASSSIHILHAPAKTSSSQRAFASRTPTCWHW